MDFSRLVMLVNKLVSSATPAPSNGYTVVFFHSFSHLEEFFEIKSRLAVL